ncbi:hypothetical protein U9R90_05480 [Streptomyces sp. E11-3]|uniref:hypothetical protein n=1 Tax=Streptomyces sp. E11-3 TaxID=3110112 RepID=UPI003980F90D
MGLELAGDERTHRNTVEQRREAAVTVADRIAAEHPHELDDLMPRLAGKQLAHDPVVAARVRELLDALGLLPTGGAK